MLGLGLGTFLTVLASACRAEQTKESTLMSEIEQRDLNQTAARQGRLLARPVQGASSAPFGLIRLNLDSRRDALLYVPARYRADQPAPLALMLHGAGGDAEGGLTYIRDFADDRGILLLSPASRRQTWDVIVRGFGPDVTFINRALEQVFGSYAVNPARIAIGGFSDGASYALSLGVTNGDLFTHIIAFSPGFITSPAAQGMPRLFISHGSRDQVLPIERCSRRIVPQVERAGYNVRYREFDGPHTIPRAVAREAVDWFAA
jgi:phospholipase/carboxylesterase